MSGERQTVVTVELCSFGEEGVGAAMMMSEAVLIASSQRPIGGAVLVFGSALCVAAVAEAVTRRRHAAELWWRVLAWVGRLFVVGVGLLMVVAGFRILVR
jgi:hypothetical protein